MINAEMYSLASDSQVQCIKQPMVIINKKYLKIVIFTDEEEAREEQLLATSRPFAFYTGNFAIQGRLHVNADAHNQDLLDETRDFFAVTDASIYPIRKVLTPPKRHVPLLFFSRDLVQAYHVIEPSA